MNSRIYGVSGYDAEGTLIIEYVSANYEYLKEKGVEDVIYYSDLDCADIYNIGLPESEDDWKVFSGEVCYEDVWNIAGQYYSELDGDGLPKVPKEFCDEDEIPDSDKLEEKYSQGDLWCTYENGIIVESKFEKYQY